MATTLNYHWPINFAMIALLPYYHLFTKGRLINWTYWVGLILLPFAANQEQVNICFLVLTTILSIQLIKEKRYNWRLVVYSLISIGEFIFTLTAPGNRERSIAEVGRWFPEYADFGLVRKLDIGIASFVKPFFFDFNPLFFLSFFLITLLLIHASKSYYGKILGSIPFLLNSLLLIGANVPETFWNVGGNFRSMIWSSGNLSKVFTKTGTPFVLPYLGTWLALLILMGLMLAFILGIWFAFSNKKKAVFLSLLILMAFCSRVIMGFSPTVWASGVRTYLISFTVMALLLITILDELRKYLSQAKIEGTHVLITGLGIATYLVNLLNR